MCNDPSPCSTCSSPRCRTRPALTSNRSAKSAPVRIATVHAAGSLPRLDSTMSSRMPAPMNRCRSTSSVLSAWSGRGRALRQERRVVGAVLDHGQWLDQVVVDPKLPGRQNPGVTEEQALRCSGTDVPGVVAHAERRALDQRHGAAAQGCGLPVEHPCLRHEPLLRPPVWARSTPDGVPHPLERTWRIRMTCRAGIVSGRKLRRHQTARSQR